MRANGHEVVGVFAPPDAAAPIRWPRARSSSASRSCAGASTARRPASRSRPRSTSTARSRADLNLLASVQVFLPREITDAPRHKSLCFHPSLLPRFRGGAALQWQIILGERESGVSIFVPDDGADTGPGGGAEGRGALSPTRDHGDAVLREAAAARHRRAGRGDGARRERARARPWKQDESRATTQGLVDDARRRDRRSTGPRTRSTGWCAAAIRSPARSCGWAGKPVRLFDAALGPAVDRATPGSVVECDAAGLAIALRGGVLRVKRVRAEAGKEAAEIFARRVGLEVGQRFESGA